MARVKVKGYGELIQVPDHIAKQVEKVWSDEKVPANKKFTIGSISVTKDQISGIFFDATKVDSGEEWKRKVAEYYTRRDELLALSPSGRAKVSAWGHFSLFFYGVFKKPPDENLKEEVQRLATEFYEKNPKWSKPSVLLWKDYLKIVKQPMIGSVINLFENIEGEELNAIRGVDEYMVERSKNAMTQEDRAEKKVAEDFSMLDDEKEIDPSKIPF